MEHAAMAAAACTVILENSCPVLERASTAQQQGSISWAAFPAALSAVRMVSSAVVRRACRMSSSSCKALALSTRSLLMFPILKSAICLAASTAASARASLWSLEGLLSSHACTRRTENVASSFPCAISIPEPTLVDIDCRCCAAQTHSYSVTAVHAMAMAEGALLTKKLSRICTIGGKKVARSNRSPLSARSLASAREASKEASHKRDIVS
mmetsp:Transcript_8403/g.52529  ORF Transcript_8403/g.52529 Transcript_8403/m.52529 type:complete len:211 (+) Transcript_8403:3922-4554(+)